MAKKSIMDDWLERRGDARSAHGADARAKKPKPTPVRGSKALSTIAVAKARGGEDISPLLHMKEVKQSASRDQRVAAKEGAASHWDQRKAAYNADVAGYRKLDRKSLEDVYKRSHRVSDTRDMSKSDLVHGIVSAKHGSLESIEAARSKERAAKGVGQVPSSLAGQIAGVQEAKMNAASKAEFAKKRAHEATDRTNHDDSPEAHEHAAEEHKRLAVALNQVGKHDEAYEAEIQSLSHSKMAREARAEQDANKSGGSRPTVAQQQHLGTHGVPTNAEDHAGRAKAAWEAASRVEGRLGHEADRIMSAGRGAVPAPENEDLRRMHHEDLADHAAEQKVHHEGLASMSRTAGSHSRAAMHEEAASHYQAARIAHVAAAHGVSDEVARSAVHEADSHVRRGETSAKTYQTGARGGSYYVSARGMKIYVGGKGGKSKKK